MARLYIENGPDKGRSITIPEGESISFGRDQTSTYALKDTMASRLHFRIERRDEDYWLVDLESMNGTLLNGQLLTESRLKGGDLIRVGDTLFSFTTEETSVGALAGHRMGGYRIVERIGRGGMGTVYKAEQVDLQREVAIKVLSDENGSDKDFIDLFVHEARASARLNHPNIVQVYDVKRHGSVYYFSMEYVSGGSLQDLLNKTRKVEPEEAVRMLLDAARGLEYAHSKGLIHRDIKPDNLMLSEEGIVKIGDLGLARRVDEKIGPSEDRAVIGTPHYIAPEQVLGREADFRSDIYSLGSTAYRMLAGITPYQAPGIRDLVSKKVKEDPKPLHEITPEVSPELSDLVHRMMARDPERRFENTPEVCAALEKISREMSGEGEEASQPISTVGNRKLLVATFALLIVVVVGGIIGGTALFDSKPEPEREEEAAPNQELALSIMQTAKEYALLDLNRKDTESLTTGIREFQVVIDNFGDSDDPAIRKIVEEARGWQSELRQDLREVQAEKLFDDLDTKALSDWRAVQNNPGDLRTVDRSIQNYSDFALQEKVKGTRAATMAEKREKHLLRWKEESAKWREAYKKVASEVALLEENQSHRDIERKLREFQDKVIRGKLDCPEKECGVPEEWYHSLLLEYEIDNTIDKLRIIAEAGYYQVEKKVKKILESHPSSPEEFDAALVLLQPIVDNSLGDIADWARSLQHTVTNRKAEWVEKDTDRKRVKKRILLEKEKKAFGSACQKAHEFILGYRFRDAYGEFKARSSEISQEPYSGRIQRRLEEVGRAVLLGNAIPRDFKRGVFREDFDISRLLKGGGKISRLTETSVTVRLSSSGFVSFAFNQFTPLEYYQFVRNGYRKMDAAGGLNLAVTCMEFGLYEEARKELEAVTLLDTYGQDNQVRLLVEEYRKMIREGRYTDADEIEAKKRIGRVERFMDGKDYEAARSEVDILKRNYGRTRAFGESQEYIQGILDEIGIKTSEEDQKKRIKTRYDEIRSMLASTDREMRRKFERGLSLMRDLKDPTERYAIMGDAYGAYGKPGKSNEYLVKAKRRLEENLVPGKVSREVKSALCTLQLGIIRNFYLAKQPKHAEGAIEEGAKLFGSDGALPLEGWSRKVKPFSYWADGGLEKIRKKVDEKEKLLKDRPDDPALLWEIGRIRFLELDDPSGALGYFLFLSENHPGYEKVKSGDCQYMVAEAWYRLKILRRAYLAYRRMKEDYSHHAMVSPSGNGKGSTVAGKITECFRLATKLGWKLTDGR